MFRLHGDASHQREAVVGLEGSETERKGGGRRGIEVDGVEGSGGERRERCEKDADKDARGVDKGGERERESGSLVHPPII